MSSADIGEEIRTYFPGTEEIIVQYLSGYLVDDACEDEDILQVAETMMESVARGKTDALEKLMARLGSLLADQLSAREMSKSKPKLTKLDKVVVIWMNNLGFRSQCLYNGSWAYLSAAVKVLDFVGHEQHLLPMLEKFSESAGDNMLYLTL